MNKLLYKQAIKYLLFLLLTIHYNTQIFSQIKADSLVKVLKTIKTDSLKAKILNELCWELKSSDPRLALNYGKEALNISKKIGNLKTEAKAMKNIGVLHLFLGDYDKAEDFFIKSLNKFNDLGEKNGISGCYNNIGLVNELKGNFTKANDYYKKSLKIDIETNNDNGVANSLNNLGNIYQKQGNYKTAIEYYIKVLKIREKTNNKIGVADSYNNIAALYETQNELDQAILNYQKALILYIENQNKRKTAIVLHNIGHILSIKKQYSEALDFYLQALEIRKEYGQKVGIASTYQNIGEIYQELNKFKEAYEYFLNSLNLYKEINDEYGISKLYNSLGSYNLKLNKYKKANQYFEKSIKLSKKLNILENLKNAYHELSISYSLTNNYSKAYKHRLLYENIKDSLENSENSKKILQIQLRYEFDKKQKEYELEKKKQRLETLKEINKQKFIKYLWIVGFSILLLVFIIIYRSYRIKKIDNKKLEIQKNEIQEKNNKLELYKEELISQNENIENQKELVTNHRDKLANQRKKLTDSIKYAKKIQNALLPTQSTINQFFTDNFLLYKPKDIVSGDFYWLKKENDLVYLAIADSTGHGVPGAFMSLLGISFLNEIVNKKENISAAEILNKLRDKIKTTLNQDNKKTNTKDGIDVALCILDKKMKTIEYAGAYNSLFIVDSEKSELTEIKGDKMPIGIHFKEKKSFTNHSFKYTDSQQFYLFTDGYVDQFGGVSDRKLLLGNFKKIIKKYSKLKFKDQKQKIEEEFESWKDEITQTDDVLIMGFKV